MLYFVFCTLPNEEIPKFDSYRRLFTSALGFDRHWFDVRENSFGHNGKPVNDTFSTHFIHAQFNKWLIFLLYATRTMIMNEFVSIYSLVWNVQHIYVTTQIDKNLIKLSMVAFATCQTNRYEFTSFIFLTCALRGRLHFCVGCVF
jgi:hypothetical protein